MGYILIGCTVNTESNQEKAAPARSAESIPEVSVEQGTGQSTIAFFRWRNDSHFVYNLKLDSKMTGVDNRVSATVAVDSTLNVAVADKTLYEELLVVSLGNPELHIEGDVQPTKEQLEELEKEISHRVWGRYRNGKLQKVYLPEKSTAQAVGIWRSVLSGMQFSAALNGKDKQIQFEYDNNGEAKTEYKKIGTGKWSREKISYLKSLYEVENDAPIGSVPTPRLLSSQGAVEIADGVVRDIILKEKVSVPLVGLSGLTGETELLLSLQKSAPIKQAALKKPDKNLLVLASNEPYKQDLPIDAMDHERMKGLTFEDTLRALVARSRDPRRKALWQSKNAKAAAQDDIEDAKKWTQDWARYFAALPAFFRQNPETIKQAEREIKSGTPAIASLLGGLSSSGSANAQKMLVKLASDTTLDDELRVQIARNLVQCRMPTAETADDVMALENDAVLKRYAVFGTGIISRKLRKSGEGDAASKGLKWLVERLDNTEDPYEKRDVLRGISNTGDSAGFEPVFEQLKDENPTVRGGAVEALRLMEHPKVDEIIARYISVEFEKKNGVRVSAIRAASNRWASQGPLRDGPLRDGPLRDGSTKFHNYIPLSHSSSSMVKPYRIFR